MPRKSSFTRLMLYLGSSLLSCLVLAQEQPQESPSAKKDTAVKNVSATKPAKEAPKLTEDQKLGFQTLEVSESASRGFDAPMRSYGLLQIGSTLATLDEAKARSILRDAFTATLEIHDDDDTKGRLQQEIFRTLLPLSQADVEELLPQAEINVRKPITESIISRYAEKKDFDKSLDLINQITAIDEFPYGSATKLMQAMPPEMMAEKQGLFSQALASYKSHDHAKRMMFGDGSLSDMVVRFGASMPPAMVLAAIDEILKQDKDNAEEQLNVTVSGDGGTASFASRYEYDLFAMLSVLKKLDESRAKQLLEENQSLQAKLQQYPQGLSSLNPPPPPGTKTDGATNRGLSTMIRRGSGPKPGASGAGQPPTASQEFMNQETMRKAEQIGQEGESDPVQAIAHSMTLPVTLPGGGMGGVSPRALALEIIAKSNVKKNPGGADQALTELRKISGDLPLRQQAQFLSSAAGIYLQMDQNDKAEKVVSEGFKVAEKLLENDVNPDNPNQALKAWWPSADAYRRFVEIETKVSHPATLNVLKEIKDPEIRAIESIMFARSLLGLPLKRFMVAEHRKDTNTMMMTAD